MNSEMVVKLIEEMVDIKVQQQAEMSLQLKPEFRRLLEEKRYANSRRLEMVRQELKRLFDSPPRLTLA